MTVKTTEGTSCDDPCIYERVIISIMLQVVSYLISEGFRHIQGSDKDYNL